MLAIPDPTSTKIMLFLTTLLVIGGVCVGAGITLAAQTEEKAERVCDNACLPRDGYVVGDTCYCENQGLSLIPIDMMIPDTGLCNK